MLAGKAILFVEDSPDVQVFVKTIARLERVELEVASTGKEALELLVDGRPFDLILLDLNLPDIPGWEILEVLREAQAGRPPVLIFSAQTDAETRERAAALGANGFILKPIGARELVETLTKFLL